MIKIAPSILSADFAHLAADIKKVENHVEMLHIDVMDGLFVPNITIGQPVVAAIKKRTKLPLDVHLMIVNPERYIEDFAAVGANSITIHAESTKRLKLAIKKIKKKKLKAAVALNPNTPITKIKPILKDLDMVLLMTVHPGFGGQKFISSVLTKIKQLRKISDQQKLKLDIQVDGGINAETAKKVVNAGANILVAGSYIYNSKNPIAAIKSLRIKK